MKKNIIRTVKMMAYYSFLGLVLQGLIVNFLFAVTPAEGQNLHDVKVSVNIVNVTLEQALQIIEQKTNFKFFYVKEDIPLNEKATVIVDDESLYNILEVFAKDYGLTFNRINDQIVVKKNQGQTENFVTAVETGTIKGKVTDAATKEPLVGASVSLRGTTLGANSDSKGNYEISNVKPGKYTVAVSYVGYSTTTKTVQVQANQTAEVNFTLGQSAINLDEVTVTGTLSERTRKEAAVQVSVIGAKELKNTDVNNMTYVLQSVPGLSISGYGREASYAYGNPQGPWQGLQLRGTTQQSPGVLSGTTKFIIDGVEVFGSSNLVTLDNSQIDRIEVSKGPMASSIYGTGASSGVIQIFTKPGGGDFHIGLSTLWSTAQNVMYNSYIDQTYTLTLSGGGSDFGYNLSYSWLKSPNSKHKDYYDDTDYIRKSYTASLYGTIGNVKARLRADFSNTGYGSYSDDSESYLLTLLGLDGDAYRAKVHSSPLTIYHRAFYSENVLLSLNVTQPLSEYFYHNLTIGYNDNLYRYNDFDNYYGYGYSNSHTTYPSYSIKYFANYKAPLSELFKIDATAGIDWIKRQQNYLSFSTNVPLVDNGPSGSAGGSIYMGYSNEITKGFFQELNLGYDDVLFLSAGLREQNTQLRGPNEDWDYLPHIGLTYVTQISDFKFKPRFSWGRSVQAVSSQFKYGFVAGTITYVGNPDLKATDQSGYEAGLDIFYSNNYSLSITYYNQAIKNPVTSVVLSSSPFRIQFYNSGSYFNRGWEFAGKAIFGKLTLDLTASVTNSTYGDDVTIRIPYQAPGLRVIAIPVSNWSANLSYDMPSFFDWTNKTGRVSVGAFYQGSNVNMCYALRNYYNTFSLPAPDSKYYIASDAFVSLDMHLDFAVTDFAQFQLDVRNIMNKQVFVGGNFGMGDGRAISAGFNFRY